MDASRLDKVEEIFPYAGPHDADTVTEAAEAIGPLVRYLNNATQQHTTLPYAGTVDEVVASLAAAAYGLDQLLQQLATALTAHRDHGRLYDDAAADPSTAAGTATAGAAIDLLRVGRSSAGELAAVLQQAHSATARLGHHES
jgi:hypothetical protein